MSSGLAGYNVRLDGVLLNQTPIADGEPFTYEGASASTDYSARVTISAVDLAGNETTPVSVQGLGETLITAAAVPEGDEMSQQLRDTIDDLTREMMTYGAVVGIYTPDLGEYYAVFGSADNSGGPTSPGTVPMTLDLKGRYGSITKMYGNTLINRQILAGHISLDDTIDMFDTPRATLSSIPNADKITIRHLIQMRSGIKDYLQQDPAVQQTYFLTPTVAFDPINYARTTASIYEPGGPVPPEWNANSGYSNCNHPILGYILEWCDLHFGTGRTMDRIFREDLFEPWGLTNTEWPQGNQMTPPYFKAYAPNLALPQVQAALGPLFGLLGWLAPLIMPGVQLTEEVEWDQIHPSWTPVCGNLGGPISDLVQFGRKLYEETETTPGLKALTFGRYEDYLLYEPVNPWDGNGWSGYSMNGIELVGVWVGWTGGLCAYHSVMFYNKVNGAVITALSNHFNDNLAAWVTKVAYALYPGMQGPPSIGEVAAAVGSMSASASGGVARAFTLPGDLPAEFVFT